MKTLTLTDGQLRAISAALQDRLHALREVGGYGATVERINATFALHDVCDALKERKGREAA